MKKYVMAVMVFLCGCATPTPLPEIEEIRYPKLGSEATTELGDTMVRYVIAAKLPSYQLLQTVQNPFNGQALVRAGTILTPFASDEVYESFREGMLCRHRETGEWCVGQNAYGDCNAFTCSLGKADVQAKPADWIDTATRNIDQQLMYNGRVGSSVKFTYREFTANGYARDSFTQDVQYDLTEGNIIGFKGVRIEVIEATNRQIRYRVLAHFPVQ